MQYVRNVLKSDPDLTPAQRAAATVARTMLAALRGQPDLAFAPPDPALAFGAQRP